MATDGSRTEAPEQVRSIEEFLEARAKRPEQSEDHRDAVALRPTDVVIAP